MGQAHGTTFSFLERRRPVRYRRLLAASGLRDRLANFFQGVSNRILQCDEDDGAADALSDR